MVSSGSPTRRLLSRWISVARPRHLDVAPSGERLAFSRYSVSSNVWSLPLSVGSFQPTGPPVPLTEGTSLRNRPLAFSVAGTRIAYLVFRAGNATEFWLMDATGEGRRPLAQLVGGSSTLTPARRGQ